MLKELWQRWVKVAKIIGDFQARLMLSLFYLLLILPFGLIARLFADPLALKKTSASWDTRQSTPPRLEDARRQF
jgi:hypothetical protein